MTVIQFPQTRAAARPLAVLLAAHTPMDQRIGGGLLLTRGHAVTIADNGWEVIAAFEREPFDVIMLDLQMPLMAGRETAKEIRFRERYTGGRIRLVGTYNDPIAFNHDRCRDAGIDGCLATPLDPAALFAMVERDDVKPPRRADGAVDVRDVLRRLDGDTELFVQLALLFLEDSPARLSEMDAALSRGDAARLRFVAHMLKGTAGNLSAPALFKAAGQLEHCAEDSRLDDARSAVRHVAAETARVSAYLRDAVVETAARASRAR